MAVDKDQSKFQTSSPAKLLSMHDFSYVRYVPNFCELAQLFRNENNTQKSSVALPHSAVGSPAVCDRDISGGIS